MDFLLAVLMLFIAIVTGIFSGEITGWVSKKIYEKIDKQRKVNNRTRL
jgi:hypothetical protein